MAKAPYRVWLVAGLLILVTLALYWPVTGHDFVNLDDPEYVTANSHVQGGLTWESVKWACSNTVCCNWHPLTVWSHMLDCQLFGLKPWGHHLTSALLHALNTALVFALLQLMTGATWRSLVVAALFALHPLRVESVAWVAERKDLLSGFFGLLSLIAYARYAEGRGQKSEARNPKPEGNPKSEPRSPEPEARSPRFVVRGPSNLRNSATEDGWSLSHLPSSFFYLLSLSLFALGLMSKPMLVTWPFVMLLLDYWPLGRMQNATASDTSTLRSATEDGQHATRNTLHASRFTFHVSLLLEKLPFFILAALGSVVTIMVQRRAMTAVESLPVDARAGNALISYGRYLGKLFWPTNLAVWYPHPGHWPLGQVILAGGVILGLSVLVWMQGRRSPYLLVGWLWFVGTLVPVIGLVQVGAQSIADRYTYLPSIGVLILAVWGACELVQGKAEGRGQRSEVSDTQHAPRNTPPRAQSQIANRQSQILLWVAGSAALLFCLVLARQQVGCWNESETLFRHALAVTKDNWLAHINLGIALHSKGQFDEALSHFQEAARLKPNHADVYSNLGVALDEKGQTDEAIRQLQKAIRLRPDHLDAHYNLGNALAKKGQTEEAIRQFQEALRLKPDNPNIHNNLGHVLLSQGQTEEAIRQFQEALRLNPGHVDAHLNLGNALAGKGQMDDAIQQLQEALRLKPDYAQTHYNLGIILSVKGQMDGAISQFQEAVRLKPAYPEALSSLAGALDGQGKHAQAIHFYQASLTALPDQAGVLNNLAWLLATCPDAAFRNGPEAVRLATRACELTRYGQPLLIGTLAAAQAEAGDFHAAIATAERAAALANNLHLERVAAKNRELLQLYRQGQPFHEKKGR
jgi:protein O-mannosyl-transferase